MRPAICSRSPSPASGWRSSGGRWRSGRSLWVYFGLRNLVHAHLQRCLALDLVAALRLVRAGHQTSPARPWSLAGDLGLRWLRRELWATSQVGEDERRADAGQRPRLRPVLGRWSLSLFSWAWKTPGSTLRGCDFGGFGYFAPYITLTTNIAAAAGALRHRRLDQARQARHLDDAQRRTLGALVAITAASGFGSPWAAILIGCGSGCIARLRRHLGGEDQGSTTRSAPSRARRVQRFWGTLATGLFAGPALADGNSPPAQAAPRSTPAASADSESEHSAAQGWAPWASPPAFCTLYAIKQQTLGHPRRNRASKPAASTCPVGLPRVLHPRPRRLRHRHPRPSGTRHARPTGTRPCR